MKKIVMVIVIVLMGLGTQAQEKKSKNAKHIVEVNGVCEQCKKRIEKAAFGVSGVKSAVWNIESHKLQLILNEQEKTSVSEVSKAVAKVGHDTELNKATKEDYDSLHSCCKYIRN
jgi:periplasmic mercuric ion binding protein